MYIKWEALAKESEVKVYLVRVCLRLKTCKTMQANGNEFTVTNLLQGTKYTIKVCGKNKRGIGPWSVVRVETEGIYYHSCLHVFYKVYSIVLQYMKLFTILQDILLYWKIYSIEPTVPITKL